MVRLASVRRSLFTNDAARSKFLAHLMTGTKEVLQTGKGILVSYNGLVALPFYVYHLLFEFMWCFIELCMNFCYSRQRGSLSIIFLFFSSPCLTSKLQYNPETGSFVLIGLLFPWAFFSLNMMLMSQLLLCYWQESYLLNQSKINHFLLTILRFNAISYLGS